MNHLVDQMALRAENQQKKTDAELLARALDYFTSQKYHECLLILQPLNKSYKLNPRYKAYLGVCCYYEWDYEQAAGLLDEAIPQLEGFAPQERSLYCWMDAESHFNLQQYAEAVPLYEQMLKLCHENERPDAYYRLAFCHLFKAKDMEGDKSKGEEMREQGKGEKKEEGDDEKMKGEMLQAKECLQQALDGYLKYRNTPDEQARIAQIKNMINGMK